MESNKGMDSFYYNDIMCDETKKIIAEDDEDLSNVAHEIHLSLINIDLRENWVLNTINMNDSEFTRLKKRILDSLNEYQQNTMTMRAFLVKLKHQDKELQDQLEDNDVEIE